MTNILNTKLGYEAMKRLAQDEFLARAILSYYEQSKKFSFKKVDKGNKEQLLENFNNLKELKKSYDGLIALLEEDFNTKFDEIENKFDLNDCALDYICKNFYKLSPNTSQNDLYKKLHKIGRMLYTYYNVTLNAAILLRTEKIMRELCVKGNIDSVNKLIDLSDEFPSAEMQILHMIYFRLYNDDNKCLVPTKNKLKDEVTCEALLNSEDKLPDSIIKELCSNSQFKDHDSHQLMIIMSTFFGTDTKISGVENDKIDNANLIFKNNLNDLESKAEFLDLEPLFELIEKGAKKEYFKFVLDLFISSEVLQEYEDIKDDGYGSI